MGKIRIAITTFIVAVLFVSAIAGTISYYNNKISNLNSQISKLNATIANLPTAHLAASLGIAEIPGNESNSMGTPTPIPYNYLYITGQVTNTKEGTAYNAGLLVVAYDATGTLEINMTLPLSGGIFGTDNTTNGFVLKNYGYSNLTLGFLASEQTAYIGISILHEGTVTNWTATPVWTNLP
jgi:outer membrane murein-binding lipoprotein Lpp